MFGAAQKQQIIAIRVLFLFFVFLFWLFFFAWSTFLFQPNMMTLYTEMRTNWWSFLEGVTGERLQGVDAEDKSRWK